jgi:hypothetical protein
MQHTYMTEHIYDRTHIRQNTYMTEHIYAAHIYDRTQVNRCVVIT